MFSRLIGPLVLQFCFLGYVSSGWAGWLQEAPMLAQQVQDGGLPPVDERLPEAPMVIEVVERIGNYGGKWRMGMVGNSDHTLLVKSVLYDGLVRWNAEWTDVASNLAERWEVSDGGRRYTFFLRKNIRWSDGSPFTTADILFWVHSVLPDRRLSGSMPSWLIVDGEEAKITAPDEYTLVFQWSTPYGLFLPILAQPQALELTHYQAAYAKRWHIDFNPALDRSVTASGLEAWVEDWNAKVRYFEGRIRNPDLPTLAAWRLTSPLGEGERLVLERNPYYWKVDSAGQQLPYIDQVIFEYVKDRKTLRQRAAAGEWTIQDRRLGNSFSQLMTYIEQKNAGAYELFRVIPSEMNEGVLAFNLTHPDPDFRALFQKKRFRQALSVAIDRQRISAELYAGQALPYQAAPRPESAFYDREMAVQYTQYDPTQANTWLDKLGCLRRADGIRVSPQGRPLRFVLITSRETDVLEFIKKDWEGIGVELAIEQMDRKTFRSRISDHRYVLTYWPGDSGLGMSILLNPFWYVPISSETLFAPGWGAWKTDPADPSAVIPPKEVQQQILLYNHLKTISDVAVRSDLMREILQIAKEQFYTIGTLLTPEALGIVKENVHNVPSQMFSSYSWPQPGASAPEQFFITP